MSDHTPDDRRVLAAISDRTATIAIIGMGYVGFPLAMAVHGRGFRVVGFDTDEAKIREIASGRSSLQGIGDAAVADLSGSVRFTASADPSCLGDADAVLICVPTPLDSGNAPDLRHVTDACVAIAACSRAGQLVGLESTTYPGTTRDVLLPILGARGRTCGRDFFLAYAPEREDPGNALHTTRTIPRLVSGIDPVSHELAVALYAAIVERVVQVSSPEVAEATKLVENVFRSVNIALVNELKVVFDRMGIDIWEVVDAASTKPFGYMPFRPGPGVGGHCIPIDPVYLSWFFRQSGQQIPLVELAGAINAAMPYYVIERLDVALQTAGVNPLRARVLLLGVSYKANICDIRESPALTLLDTLSHRGCEVCYHDLFVPALPATRGRAGLRSVPLTPESLASQDAVIVVSGHAGIDYASVVAHARLVVDTRHVVPQASTVVRA